MNWFRAHHGITSDKKWPVVSKISGQRIGDVVAVWMALLEHASQSDDRGDITEFDPETIDVLYGYDDGVTASIITALELKGMISNGRIINWDKRQPEREDHSTERVRRFRERQKQTNESEQINDTKRQIRTDKIR